AVPRVPARPDVTVLTFVPPAAIACSPPTTVDVGPSLKPMPHRPQRALSAASCEKIVDNGMFMILMFDRHRQGTTGSAARRYSRLAITCRGLTHVAILVTQEGAPSVRPPAGKVLSPECAHPGRPAFAYPVFGYHHRGLGRRLTPPSHP